MHTQTNLQLGSRNRRGELKFNTLNFQIQDVLTQTKMFFTQGNARWDQHKTF